MPEEKKPTPSIGHVDLPAQRLDSALPEACDAVIALAHYDVLTRIHETRRGMLLRAQRMTGLDEEQARRRERAEVEAKSRRRNS